MSPFKSQAQRRKFAQLLVEGKISPDTYEEWNRETGSARLPERLKRRGSASKRRAASGAKKKKAKATRTTRRKTANKRARKR
jgi:hypothetical protein